MFFMLLPRVIRLVAFILGVFVGCLITVFVVHFLAVFASRVPTHCFCSCLLAVFVSNPRGFLLFVGHLLLISVGNLLVAFIRRPLAVFIGRLLAVFVSHVLVFVGRSSRCFSRLFFSSFFHSSHSIASIVFLSVVSNLVFLAHRFPSLVHI